MCFSAFLKLCFYAIQSNIILDLLYKSKYNPRDSIGISYCIRKNPAKQDSPPAAGRVSDILPFRRSAIPRRAFCSIGIIAFTL